MLLFTPGPTPTPEFIRNALALPTIHHRTQEFESIFSETRELLKDMIKMPEVLMLSSSGSGAMEASLLTFCAKKVLTINSGKFGERFSKIANAFNIPYIEITNEWDTPAGLECVINALKANPDIDAICMQVCESAGGLRHSYEVIAKAIKEYNKDVTVIIDAITAMGVEPLDVSNVDVLIGGSQKAFMLPAGMSIIGLSQFALEKLESRNVGFYFNLKTELKNQQKNTTAWSAPVSLATGLCAFLKEAKKIGYENIYKETKARSLACDCVMENLGLRIYPKIPALAMTTVIDDDAEKVRKMLKNDFNVNIAGGQDRLKGKIFRINHMGIIPIHEISWVVNAIELCLSKLKRREFNGLANQIFLQQYYSIMES
ncbi:MULTISPECIES: pyridoxal-phosphate-dependent aminotransferase family protein [Helicobacter]|uniref:Alanine--glyoxylate aminotransferase family protein n=1 Tax=Helicobacter ibis TaxID=2962633 RepID=A0ABT4VEH6_9HELI|nr:MULTISPECIES: alanine--glyoxylate aminotransferase family protein [Helicobacter]MDA3967453.1 alanine--glyoxylate aminotransferase family protein [Helicobacter sp. WB40]MDA3969107.1 alanine--glyoxylate aminotransferase family protein [Helicobacter ibis]